MILYRYGIILTLLILTVFFGWDYIQRLDDTFEYSSVVFCSKSDTKYKLTHRDGVEITIERLPEQDADCVKRRIEQNKNKEPNY